MDYKQYILDNFNYNPDSGEIIRHDRSGGNGSYDKYGYLILKIKGRQFKSHRVAWLLYYGNFPEKVIDHINGVRDDNRIENLREITQRGNSVNRVGKINKDTGEIGIYFDKTKGLNKNFTVKLNGKTKRFLTIQEAKKYRENEINQIITNSIRAKGSQKPI